MQLTFLQADKPLTKKYTKRPDGGYDSESYPMLFRVTSHVENVHGIEEFAEALKKHAELGHCLHTGSLDRPLVNESRKGHHDKDEMRSWIVLDLDGLSFNGVEELLAEMPPAFGQTSYIVQESPSSGIKPGLRAHVFFLLEREEQMKDIKTWLMHINLVTEKLRDEITLTAKDFALSYPLDRIANDNGRVVYITAPECVGFQDPVVDRIRVVHKDRERLKNDFRASTVSDVKQLEREHIDALRAAAGLPKSRVKDYYETDRFGREVLKRKLTERGRVHPIRQDSENVMRCNLDDGDSEAYFYYISHPALLRNHKGEPNLFMEAVDPEYYEKVAMPAARASWEKDNQPFVFRNSMDDKWYCGIRRGDEIVKQPAQIGSESKIEDFFADNGGFSVPDPIQTWDMRFMPSLNEQWNPDERIFNTWRMTEIMKNAQYRSLPPPIITKIIGHVTGGGEEYERFINWLAYVYQRRAKTGTAWIFHGVQGTGKGLLVGRILTPILGPDYVIKQQSRNLKAEFNGFLEKALIVNLDEFDLYDAGNDASGVMQALKMWITDDRFNIRAMYRESVQMDNFSNFIITTNSQNSIPIPAGDRRFNFGVRQEQKLEITPEEVDEIRNELEHFAGYLSGYEVDKTLAHTTLENETKRKAQELSKNSIEEFADAIRYGDIAYFIGLLNEPSDDYQAKGEFRKLIEEWTTNARAGHESVVSADRMIYAYMIATGDTHKTIAKFKKAMHHKALPAERVRLHDGTRPSGWKIKWNLSDEDKKNLGLHLKAVNAQTDLEDKVKEQLQAPVSPHNMET